MARFDIRRTFRSGLAVLAIAGAGLLAACGPGSSSTSVVLTGPPEKVEALIAQYRLHDSPVQAHLEKLADGRERAAFTKPGACRPANWSAWARPPPRPGWLSSSPAAPNGAAHRPTPR